MGDLCGGCCKKKNSRQCKLDMGAPICYNETQLLWLQWLQCMVTMMGDLQPGCLADRLLTGLGQPKINPKAQKKKSIVVLLRKEIMNKLVVDLAAKRVGLLKILKKCVNRKGKCFLSSQTRWSWHNKRFIFTRTLVIYARIAMDCYKSKTNLTVARGYKGLQGWPTYSPSLWLMAIGW